MRPRTSLPTTMLSPLTSSMIASTRPISIAAKSIVTRFAGPPNSEATAAVVRIHSGRPAPQRRPLHAPTHRKSRTDPPLFPLFPPSLSFRPPGAGRGRAAIRVEGDGGGALAFFPYAGGVVGGGP